MKTWAFGAMVVSMFAATAGCGAKGTTGTTTGDNSGGSGGTGSDTTGSNTTGSNTTGSNTTGSNTTGSNTTGAGGGTGCAATGQDFQIPACNDCVATNCCAEQTACDTGTECDTTFTCLKACASGDKTCQMACGTASQQGATDHDALITCLQASCMAECAAPAQTPICMSGFATSGANDPCGTCLGANCCDEFTACGMEKGTAAMPKCHECALGSMDASCKANALLTAASTCQTNKCKAECM